MAADATFFACAPGSETDVFDQIADRLAMQGWAITPQFVAPEFVDGLRQDIERLEDQNRLRSAAVGRGDAKTIDTSIRGDRILWLGDDVASLAQHHYLARMEQLRMALNQSLFLGLAEFECHFAYYPTGAFYARHIDQHANQDSRVISAILYLNAEWMPQDAGELRIYFDNEESFVDIPPVAGTLVTFLSDRFYHEVLAVGRPRHSVTGWFRRRPLDTAR